MNTNQKKIRNVVLAAVIAAMYAALTVLQNIILPGTASMAVQVRVSEALNVLAMLTPAAIPGLTIGCVVANLTAVQFLPLDMIIGSLATLFASILMYKCRDIRFKKLPLLSCFMPVIFNAVFVGAEIAYFMAQEGQSFFIAFLTNAAFVALGELISVYVLGLPLFKALEGRKIFNMKTGG